MKKRKILLVEDEKVIADMYAFKLRSEGFDVDHAIDGLDGIKKLNEEHDLVLLDLYMPRLDGAKFLEKIRKNERFQDTTVIVLTNLGRQEAPKTIWHHNIAGYYVKAHSTPAELSEMINKHLQDAES